jgi:predicted metal-dependent hydrolase
MTAEQIVIDGIPLELVRKRVRYLNLTVFPPDGRVRVAAPQRASLQDIRGFVAARKTWIERQRERARALPVPAKLDYESGEGHTFLGRVYRLNVIEAGAADASGAAARAAKRGTVAVILHEENAVMDLTVPAGSTRAGRQKILEAWYRAELVRLIPPRLARWEALVGAETHTWGVKRMRTKWGTCNTRARRIWLALELAKKPLHLIDYIVAHELTHLLEASHNARFKSLMDRVMPDWRDRRRELQLRTGPLRPEEGI